MTAACRFLFICRQPPFGLGRFGSGLDLLLTAATFEQPVTLVFIGEGVMQLRKGLDGEPLEMKNPAKALAALNIYGVDSVYAEADSLEAQNLDTGDLALPVTAVSSEQISAWVQDADHVVVI